MERTAFSLLFYIRRHKINKEGKVSIFMRITINGQRADASAKCNTEMPTKNLHITD